MSSGWQIRTGLMIVGIIVTKVWGYYDDINECSFIDGKNTLENRCPLWGDEGLQIPLEHLTESCDLRRQNSEQNLSRLFSMYDKTIASGGIKNLPIEQSWHCDDIPEQIPPLPKTVTPLTSWIIRNQSSNPISIGFYHPDLRRDVSAMDPNMAVTYPHDDPRAVVQAGRFMVLSVFLGHVFHVHQLLPVDGENNHSRDKWKQGDLLLRYIPGAIPIPSNNVSMNDDITCDLVDLPPGENIDFTKFDSEDEILDRVMEEKAAFTPNPFKAESFCHVQYRAFVRNNFPCPLDVYFAGAVNLNQLSDQQLTSSQSFQQHSCPTCKEMFAFHLGLDQSVPDVHYMDAWESPIAIASTYLSHKFVVRLRSNPSIIVDEIVIDRTNIKECNRKAPLNSTLAEIERAVQNEDYPQQKQVTTCQES